MANNFRKIGRGLYTDEKGNIGKLAPTGRGGWYIKSLDELPDEIKKDKTPSYKKDNEINRQIKQYYSMADDYYKERVELERQKNIERRINGELSSKYKEIEDLQSHKERIERDYRNSALKLEDARQRQVMNNEFGISIKKEELNNLKQAGKGPQAKVKEGTPLQSMADQRVHEIEETLYNDKTMLRYAKSKKLNGVGGMTTQELENQIKQKEKYIRIAKGDKYLKEVDNRINSVETDISPMSEYSGRTREGHSYLQEKELNNIKIKSLPKTKEQKVMQGNYGYGWEDLEHYDKDEYKEAKENLRLYRENEPYSFKLSTRRVPMEYKQKGSKKETFTKEEVETIKAQVSGYKKRKNTKGMFKVDGSQKKNDWGYDRNNWEKWY